MNIDFIKNRTKYYVFASFLILFSIISAIFIPLNLWIDVTGWAQIEFEYKWSVDISKINSIAEETKKELGEKYINNITTYKVAWEDFFIVEAWFNKKWIDQKIVDLKKWEYKELLVKNITKYSSSISFLKYTWIWEVLGDYIKNTAYMTIVLVLIAISLYVWWTFRKSEKSVSGFSFSAVTLLSLFHDVITSFWAYVLVWFFFKEFKIDIFFVTAMLTVLGYSVNDTIVIMDRIRSTLQKQKWNINLKNVVNDSINSTLTRSIFTSVAVFFMLVALFLFWPQSIKWFTLVMIFWTIFGTYSSVALAATMLYDLNKNKFNS